MTIQNAIERIDSLLFNTYSQDDKVEWLSRLDTAVKQQIIDAHEGGDLVAFNGYDANTDLTTVLLVPAPYDEMYLRWMEAQIHYHNAEFDKFNNAIIMYNTAFENYHSHYLRTHKPVQTGRRFLF